jgi:hypothetical protein
MSALVHLDLARLPKKKDRGGKIVAQCPACAELGRDSAGEHLAVFADGRFACAAHAGDHAHRQRIFEMIGRTERQLSSGPALAVTPRPAPKPVDLLARIKADFPASVADLWESSPVRCDEDLEDAKAFLRLFPLPGILWIAPDIFQSGKPEHARFFRTRAEWEAETFIAHGTRIAPAAFSPGAYGRSRENVAEHLFAVIESDEIGDGKLYASKDDFCTLIRWLREACGWHLAAVVDSGGKSLHAWFRHPGQADTTHLAEHAAALGLDRKFSEPAQPWRLPGPRRENAETRQELVYLNLEGSL